ncbi:tetratricopeptide repeat protein [Coleofasciculus sp. FACHB-1120]|uniref:tetratricopeptide repeat protein n=1 Tax=Coleofasciculus sp. FACHB-1120 TaxID=2692783 RepID=UPI0016867D78|nr:tetratricopeptide repeat protein [Coleofasciculus sp. FACHB-1120]MBD2740978.1 tetratricopeptide repeat protein [Coleofasciculus sp. FACHB-1120]
MTQGENFSQEDYQDDSNLTPDAHHQKIQDEQTSPTRKALALFEEGLKLAEAGKYKEAVAHYQEALGIQPDSEKTLYNYGLSLSYLSRYNEAVSCYDKAINLNLNYSEAWTERAYALMMLNRGKEALASCDKALQIHPKSYQAWYKRGWVLSKLNRRQEAIASCDKALEINPNGYEAWCTRGAVLPLPKRRQEALSNFDKSLEINPAYQRAWYNRGSLLVKLGRNEEALASFEKATTIRPDCQEFWFPQAWYGRGFILAKLHRYQEAVASFEKALQLKPEYAAAAFYKLICLLITGKIFPHLVHSEKRKHLFNDLKIIVNAFKYQFLFLATLIFVISSAQSPWATNFKQLFSTLFSIGIIWFILGDLWKNKSQLSWVLAIYFKSGILSYVRAAFILFITLTTFAVVNPYVPQFMQWGWASAVFGNSGNIIFQPFDTIKSIQPPPEDINSQLPSPSESVSSNEKVATQPKQSPGEKVVTQPKQSPNTNVATQPRPIPKEKFASQTYKAVPIKNKTQKPPFDYTKVLMVIFWICLILMVPFWAGLEEKIFRQGANTWKQIIGNSTAFGLVHITVGIPIYAGFLLIIPGFLFACRYKFVHDQSFRKNNNEKIAQEAGVQASTADHAIYNAILITFLVFVMLTT